ncbi:MAG: hypothetical protein ACR2LE_09685 [Nocardioidaceae bacterium]
MSDATANPSMGTRLKTFYGANPLHLLSLIACFALLGYIILVAGLTSFWDTSTWWQSELVWFIGAIIVHDLVLFPLYALADRSLAGALRAIRPKAASESARVPALNYVRVPALGAGLLLLMFFPGIIQQGGSSYLSATGQTQDPFLERWLLITFVMFVCSALVYAVRSFLTHSHKETTQAATE